MDNAAGGRLQHGHQGVSHGGAVPGHPMMTFRYGANIVSMSGSFGPTRTTPMSPQPIVPSTESRRRYMRPASCNAAEYNGSGRNWAVPGVTYCATHRLLTQWIAAASSVPINASSVVSAPRRRNVFTSATVGQAAAGTVTYRPCR